MVVKIASYYNNELGVVDRIRFYLFDKLYNNILRNATKNFFPLTDQLKKFIQILIFKKMTMTVMILLN